MNFILNIPPNVFYNPDYECFFDSEYNIMNDEFHSIWISRVNEFPFRSDREEYTIGQLILDINHNNEDPFVVM